MNMAKPRALLLVALWLTASVALAALPATVHAQSAATEDPSGPGDPGVGAGDPDQPDPAQPPKSVLELSRLESGVYAGRSFGPVSEWGSRAPVPGYRYPAGRRWLDSLIWAFKIRLGWL